MPWQLVDRSLSRNQHTGWNLPEKLGKAPEKVSISFQQPLVPDPDELLQFIDDSISIFENEQADTQLSSINSSPVSISLFPISKPMSSLLSSSSSLSSSLTSSFLGRSPTEVDGNFTEARSPAPSLGNSLKDYDRFRTESSLSLTCNISRGELEPPRIGEYGNSMFKLVFKGEASSSSWSPDNLFAEEHASLGVDDCSISDLEIGGEDCCNVDDTERESDDNSDKGEVRDNNSDDDIYEAACSALSAGNADLGLSLLHEALEKYPIDDVNAPEKVQRLFAAALQIVEKNSAALSLLPSTI